MWTLLTTSSLDRRVVKFTRAHPEIKRKLAQVLRDLEEDPFKPRLRLHPLKGQLGGLHAISLIHGFRITLILRAKKKEIALLDIGSHEDVYR